MLKPTSTYKMSKTTKRSLALSPFQDPHAKGQWKRAMIDAELCSRIVVKTPQRDKNAPRGTANYNTTSTSATPSAE